VVLRDDDADAGELVFGWSSMGTAHCVGAGIGIDTDR
jgi:hypothetical protein